MLCIKNKSVRRVGDRPRDRPTDRSRDRARASRRRARATTRATTTPAHSRVAAVALSLALATSPLDADAVASVGQKPPPTISTPEGCTLRALDAFSDVRAKFSLEVSTLSLIHI